MCAKSEIVRCLFARSSNAFNRQLYIPCTCRDCSQWPRPNPKSLTRARLFVSCLTTVVTAVTASYDCSTYSYHIVGHLCKWVGMAVFLSGRLPLPCMEFWHWISPRKILLMKQQHKWLQYFCTSWNKVPMKINCTDLSPGMFFVLCIDISVILSIDSPQPNLQLFDQENWPMYVCIHEIFI